MTEVLLSLGTSIFLLILAIILVGPRRMVQTTVHWWHQLLPNAHILVISITLALAFPVLAAPYSNISDYWMLSFASLISFIALIQILQKFSWLSSQILAGIQKYSVFAVILIFIVLTAAGNLLILKGFPHIIDEAAYQFQAQIFAQGKLYLSTPAIEAPFEISHALMDQGKWYGIMNPGWPLVLAVGYVLNLPWLVNPLLGGLTLFFLYAFYLESGYGILESKIALLFVAIAPFVFFLTASFMGHTLSLFLFVLFIWSWNRLIKSKNAWYAGIVGTSLGFGFLVRPFDAVVVSLPFLLYTAFKAWKEPAYRVPLALTAGMGAIFVALFLGYNQQLTGNFFETPTAKYFAGNRFGGEFGIGFGSNMGTQMHGPEFPGYYPSDAVRVSSYRLSELFMDFNGLPVLIVALLVLSLLRWKAEMRGNHGLLVAAGLAIIGFYTLHFYHGIAYGPRYFALAVPAIGILLARPFAVWVTHNSASGLLVKTALSALVIYTLIFPYPRLVHRYTNQYRLTSTAFRDYLTKTRLTNAVIFVAPDNWGWKSAYPLNTYPYAEGDVIFVMDLEEYNQAVIDQFKGKKFLKCRLSLQPEAVSCNELVLNQDLESLVTSSVRQSSEVSK